MITSTLGLLLHVANTRPPWIGRDRFYALKDALLKRYGTHTGTVVQHIIKECFSCDGTGLWRGQDTCWKCNGSGIFDEFWTVLDCHELGGYRFHSPRGSRQRALTSLQGVQVPCEVIEGYIRHTYYSHHLSSECRFWLYLIFDRKSFWQEFGRWGAGSKPRTPLVVLSTWFFNVRMMVKYRRGRWKTSYDQYDSDIPF